MWAVWEVLWAVRAKGKDLTESKRLSPAVSAQESRWILQPRVQWGELSHRAWCGRLSGRRLNHGGAGSTEACGVGCAELEVLSASHDMSWPICAFPGLCAATVEPSLGALRRDGNAERMLRNVRTSHAAGAVMGEVRSFTGGCHSGSLIDTLKHDLDIIDWWGWLCIFIDQQ